MYNRMLVPLDGSEAAESVLPYAEELGGRLNLEVIFLHVCEIHESESQFMCQAYIDHVAEKVEGQAQKVQAKTEGSSEGKKVTTRTEVVSGQPAETILRFADEQKVDLILLASHGHSSARRWMVGSVADKVLRASSVPVWLVQARAAARITRKNWLGTMVVLLDGSPLAEAALPHMEALARQHGSGQTSVTLLRIAEEPSVLGDYPEASMALNWEGHVKKMKDYFRKSAENYLSQIERKLAASGLKTTSKVLMGKPANEIIAYIEANSPDLVVMTTHGFSGISHWEYGAVADKIIRGVTSPIFLVRPK